MPLAPPELPAPRLIGAAPYVNPRDFALLGRSPEFRAIASRTVAIDPTTVPAAREENPRPLQVLPT